MSFTPTDGNLLLPWGTRTQLHYPQIKHGHILESIQYKEWIILPGIRKHQTKASSSAQESQTLPRQREETEGAGSQSELGWLWSPTVLGLGSAFSMAEFTHSSGGYLLPHLDRHAWHIQHPPAHNDLCAPPPWDRAPAGSLLPVGGGHAQLAALACDKPCDARE